LELVCWWWINWLFWFFRIGFERWQKTKCANVCRQNYFFRAWAKILKPFVLVWCQVTAKLTVCFVLNVDSLHGRPTLACNGSGLCEGADF